MEWNSECGIVLAKKMCDSNFEEEKQQKSVVWQIAQNLSKNVDNVDFGAKVIHIHEGLILQENWVMHKVIHIIHQNKMWNTRFT